MDNEDQTGFKWESSYTEGLGISTKLREDERGSIEDSIQRIIHESKRQLRPSKESNKFRLGIMRYIYICLDFSNAMIDQEPYPSRLKVTLDVVNFFLDKFFELNPLSQIGIIACRGKHADRLSGLTSCRKKLRECLVSVSESYCRGEFSLNAVLRMALQSYKCLPPHSNKEILMINSSLSTIDAGSVTQTFRLLKMNSIQCSVVSFAPEIFLLKRLCSTTFGKYSVVLNKKHLELLINDLLQPPLNNKQQYASVIKMGFPVRKKISSPSLCMCHDYKMGNKEERQTSTGFFCPQCLARYCQTPAECKVCGLLLLTAPQLARASQHLVQLSPFNELAVDEKKICYGCGDLILIGHKSYGCDNCKAEFCIDCDLLLHESLQVCPSCG